ncbi:glycosyltransferase [Cohnella xylanilytica]|uniref:Glycosyltransferase n=1 Tax=Cohnella xylanilytica TaxID=557555 RepID=A0A841U5A9_9BACL|nr:glycosyltransferase [Cohnella xylanilytica]MBB6693251.1 glycosyltransferase [Cohnella xylanilytica]
MGTTVLHITENYPPFHCGVGDYVSKLITYERKSGIRSYVGMINGQADNTTVFAVDTKAKRKYLKDLIKKINPDVLHFHIAYSPHKIIKNGLSYDLLPYYSKSNNRKIILTYHQYPNWTIGLKALKRKDISLVNIIRIPIDWCAGLLYKAFHKKIHSVVVVDDTYSKLMSRRVREKIEKIDIPSNINKREVSNKEIENFKSKFKMNSGKWIGFFGFLFKEKGFEDLIEVVKKTNYNLLYVGEIVPDNVYRKRILERIENENLKERITVTGYLEEEEVPVAIRSCGAFVLPFISGYSTKNGSLKAIMNEGTFIVTTTLENNEKGYDSNRNSYFVAPSDISGMIDALNEYYGRSSSNSYGAEQWEDVIEIYGRLYK